MIHPSTTQLPARSLYSFLLFSLLVVSSVLYTAFASTDADDAPNHEENKDYFFACSGGELSKIQDLLSTDPSLVNTVTNDGEHCLHLSALSGNAEIVQLLLEKGADPNVRSTFEGGLRMHPLSWCTYYGRNDIIELLLKHGADVNADFDLGGGEPGGESVKVTALDVIEKILFGIETDEGKERFLETRNVLVKNGAKRWASLADLEDEL
jgi:hypothetical protein|mmetsp:Transcript_20981/g.45435  ORF Transcript_20981/g.45435 Transcript_20981/m.45435 type:complete len:209 (-) Transcript_20981:531-1157(-)